MDLSQTMIGHHLQHPLGPGAILYPGKGSAWQPVVTSLPSMVDIPKESIIANTDFTTTSVIAKRRLSSKKRKKVASQQQAGSDGASASSDHPSSCSPMGSTNGSPAVSSTTCTPPAMDKTQQHHDDSLSRSTASITSIQNITTSSHGGITTSSSSSTHIPHHIGHHHPTVNTAGAGGGVQYHHHHHHPSVTASGQFISVAPVVATSSYHHPHHPTVATAQTQFANPVLSQLQQELNYRFLQDGGSSGVLIAHPNQVDQPQPSQQVQGFRHHRPARRDSTQAMEISTSVASAKPATHGSGSSQRGFKWCYAHVAIAKQIQQQQARAKKLTTSSSSLTPSSLSTSHMTHSQSNSAPSIATSVPVSVAAAAATHQQQQHQLALLQMYGLPAAAPAIPATAMPGGYMAVPYSSMQEVQMRMNQLAAAASVTGASLHPGVSLVKPVGMDSMSNGAETLLSLNPAAAAGACGPATVQMVNGLHLQATPYGSHSIPIAAVAAAPSDMNNAVFHGAASGQWMAPVPVVGSCIVNPLQQPGIMATPWVK